MYQRQRVAQPLPKQASRQTLASGKRPLLQEHDLTLRDSSLTFAVVWDPESGALQSFTGDSLGKLSNYVEENEKELPTPPVPPKTWSTSMRAAHWQNLFDRTRPLGRPNYARNSPRLPQASLLFSDSDSIATIPSIYSDNTETWYGQWQPLRQAPPSHNAKPTTSPMTPNSDFTFAALWDPKRGFCTFRDGVLTPVSDTPPRPENRPSKLLYDDPDLFASDWDMDSEPTLTNPDYLPAPPNPHHAFPSTKAKNSALSASESQLSFDYPTHYATFCDTPQQGVSSKLSEDSHATRHLEDEGFFDSFASHSDCEPHLPSRFSTTTFYTSSSRYLNADLTSIATPGANSLAFPSAAVLDARLERQKGKPKSLYNPEEPTATVKPLPVRKISLPASRAKDHGAQTAGSFKLQAPPLPRLSNVLKGPWSKRRPTQENEKWVLIDVRPIGK